VTDLAGKHVLIVGLGRSGLASARVCAERGAHVVVSDKRDRAQLSATLAKLPAGVETELGGHVEASFLRADLIVLSPGVPELPELGAARVAGVQIVGEMELASWFIEGQIVAITGTNGKSTTTTLCGAIVRASGFPTFIGGNLGEPLS